MNKLFICIAFVCFSTYSLAQTNHVSGVQTTMFDYGKPVKTADDNFKNLFRNFPKFIPNANQNIRLTSYKYVTDVKSREDINVYLKKNEKVYLTNGDIFSKFGPDNVAENAIKIIFPSNDNPKPAMDKAELDKHLAFVASSIHPGDKVYVINFWAEGKDYEFYTFVNQQTNQVLKKGSFLGFDIPVYYADFFSKKS